MSDERQATDSDETARDPGDTLTLETLGSVALVHIARAGTRTLVFGPSKPLALIVYLASVPGRSATRDFLIDLLWADLDPQAARHAFRQTLWYVKQKTGHALVRATGDTVALAEPIPSDRADLLRAVEARDFETAVSFYRGDFLPDFAAPGGLQFEHWADLERQRLRDTFTRAAEHVVRHCLAAARHRDAVALARRARDTDPLSENSWRLLLESLLSANDSLGASLEADALQKMLAEEERQPEPATQAMLRAAHRISAEPAAEGPAPSAIVAELVGREAEFSTLLAAWGQAKAGTARTVTIVGAAGIGKTRLIGDVVARLRATRARTVWVRASPGEREIAYSLLSKLAAALAALPGAAAVSPDSAAALVALNPALSSSFSAAADRSTGPEALRRRTIAMHELLAAAAHEAPVAIVVDDLHWADRESARALNGVAGLLAQERVLLMTAARPSNTGMDQSSGEATVIRLSPLTAADMGALLASVGSLPDSALAQRLPGLVRDASDGVPLLALETLQFLLDRDVLRLDDNAWVIHDENGLLQALNAGGALRRRIEALDPAERSVLDALSLAGVPIHTGFVGQVVERPLPDVAAILHSLEMRGMVNHVGDGWEPVHDQIGELAAAGLDAEARRATEAAVGRAWLHAGPDDYALRRAGTHFLRAGDQTATARAFAAWVRHMRRVGDHRPPELLAADFADTEREELVSQLVRGLPFKYRHRASRWRAAATIVLVAIASAAATWRWARQPAPAPDAQFLAVAVDPSGDTAVYRVGIRRDRWQGGDPLIVPEHGQRIRAALPPSVNDYTVTPDGKTWISHASMPDSGGDDLVSESMTGEQRRLTATPGDDRAADLAPDGSQLVFTTGRFDSLSHAQIAVMDLVTHHVRQLTYGSGANGAPKWAPSGVLIAFGHQSLTAAPDSVCIIAPDGSGRYCWNVGTQPTVDGWIDDDRLLVSGQSDSSSYLDLLDVRDGSMRRIQRMATARYKLSPDGRWMYCECREIGAPRAQSLVFPTDHPERARPLEMGALDTRPVQLLWTSPRPATYVTALATPLPAAGLPVGAAYELTTFGITADGGREPLDSASHTSSDTGVVRVGPGERLIGVAPGTARVVVSAGGWRADTIELRVVAGRDSVVLHDDWSQGVVPEFVPFGDPLPTVVHDSSGKPAFWNHGDGNFPSGAYSRPTFDAARGLGMEVALSTPISLFQWQWQNTSLRPLRDAAGLARWDHRTGYPPWDRDDPASFCSLVYPNLEGARNVHTLTVPGHSLDPDSLFRPPLHDGHWYRVRLQIFPDGRCGVAVNGRPIAIYNTGALPAGPYIAVFQGQSYHTRILTGPVDLWTGIRPGVDWLAFDTARAVGRRHAP